MKLLLLVVVIGLGGACAEVDQDSARVTHSASQTFEDDPELAFDPIQEDEADEEEEELSQFDR